MRVLIQRVKHASCTVEGKITGKIEQGFLMFVGCCDSDDDSVIAKMAAKASCLRIFEDEQGKMNKSLEDVGGSILSISQFTLYADCRKGNRPSFTDAGAPDHANRLYEYFMERCRMHVEKVAHGEFGADMKVDLLNDGPFTLMLDSKDLLTK